MASFLFFLIKILRKIFFELIAYIPVIVIIAFIAIVKLLISNNPKYKLFKYEI